MASEIHGQYAACAASASSAHSAGSAASASSTSTPIVALAAPLSSNHASASSSGSSAAAHARSAASRALGVGIVVDAEHQRPARVAREQRPHALERRQRAAADAAGLDERGQVAAVVAPRVVPVLVVQRCAGVERVDQRAVELSAVARAVGWRSLTLSRKSTIVS